MGLPVVFIDGRVNEPPSFIGFSSMLRAKGLPSYVLLGLLSRLVGLLKSCIATTYSIDLGTYGALPKSLLVSN